MSKSRQAILDIFQQAEAHRISKTALAEAAGVTRVTLSNWRSGRTAPTLDAYLAVCDALEGIIKSRAVVS